MATGSRAGTRVVVGRVDELPEGSTRVIDVQGRSIGVFHDQGRFTALRNVCPHHGAPLCVGSTSGTMITTAPHVYEWSDDPDERVVRCPWHGYEFRLSDGRSITDPQRMRVRTYVVEVEGEHVVLYV